ncbi:MAG: helix-turn-helix transcriptional regulator [Candidatus Manganitrophaceae bacterium]
MPREISRDRVGDKIRERRVQVGLSQGELGDRLGVSYQQVQKYEKGTSQLTVEKLQKIAQILDVEIDYFLKDLPPVTHVGEAPAPYGGLSPDERRLLQQYRAIPDPSARQALLRLVQVVGRLTRGKSSATKAPF